MADKTIETFEVKVLGEDDRAHIVTVFEEKIVPKLKLYQARIGSLGCGFAGEAYARWVVHFRPSGDDYEITELEYDEDGNGLDLDF
jgi:hypothetical protein